MNLLFPEKKNTSNGRPKQSKGIFTDIKYFIIHKPLIPTLIKFSSKKERQDFSQRIMQRLDIDVNKYSILNMHKIGINVPIKYVFDELLMWNGDSSCWPNHIAKVNRIKNNIENICIFLFGISKYPFGFKNKILGLKFVPLFNLTAIKIQKLPDPIDFDNARYLLYKCSGGYPVGVFSLYARSAIKEQNETQQTQLFFLVGFNFYGREKWSNIGIVNRIWELIHDRVTTNIMNRFKQLCEQKFKEITNN